MRHNLLSANRRGVDVKHAQTHVPGLMPGAVAVVLSVSFSIETLPDAGIMPGFVRRARTARVESSTRVRLSRITRAIRAMPRLFAEGADPRDFSSFISLQIRRDHVTCQRRVARVRARAQIKGISLRRRKKKNKNSEHAFLDDSKPRRE